MISVLLLVPAVLCSLMFLFGTISADSTESQVSRRASMLPSCDSERPDSWASHRTLTVPESCLTGSSIEIAMVNTLCCVYTHVVVTETETSKNNNNRPTLETYDGDVSRIGDCGTSTSIEVMEEVMGRICGMSMGSRDCFDQAVCIEDAKTTVTSPADTDTDNDNDDGNGANNNASAASDSLATSTSPSPIANSYIPTVIPTSTATTDLDLDDNSTTISPFPSTSPPPSQSLSPVLPYSNATNTTASWVAYASSSGSLPVLSSPATTLSSCMPILFLCASLPFIF